MRVGMIGLGRMGAGLAARLTDAGHEVVGFDRQAEARRRLDENGGEAVESLAALVAALSPPRVCWMMLPEGRAVEETLEELEELLAAGDRVVDGGNSNYRDTRQRAERLTASELTLIDVGTSGGIWGRHQGYCLMVGGPEAAVGELEPLFEALAPAPDRGWARVGPSGAGHFVKMVHNGIEYGLMQAYAEGFAILRRKHEMELDLHQVAEVWRYGSVVRSWLLELIGDALAQSPGLEDLEPWVEDSGEGRWTVQEALDLDSPAPVITLALLERSSSRDPDSFSHRLLAAMRHEFGGHAVRRKE